MQHAWPVPHPYTKGRHATNPTKYTHANQLEQGTASLIVDFTVRSIRWASLSSCLDLEKCVEGGAVELLGEASDREDDEVSHVPCLHHQVNFIITVDNNLEPVLIIAIQLNLQGSIPCYRHISTSDIQEHVW